MRPLSFGSRRSVPGNTDTPKARAVAVSLLVAASAVAMAIAPAAATYPGTTNGALAFGIKDAAGNGQINVMQPDGTGLKVLTSGAFNHLCAAYSADGSR